MVWYHLLMVINWEKWLLYAEDIEKLSEMEPCGTAEHNLEVVIANLTDIDSLEKAFEGCRGVFHTSAFTDPAGLSGYTVCQFFFSFKLCFHTSRYKLFKPTLALWLMSVHIVLNWYLNTDAYSSNVFIHSTVKYFFVIISHHHFPFIYSTFLFLLSHS